MKSLLAGTYNGFLQTAFYFVAWMVVYCSSVVANGQGINPNLIPDSNSSAVVACGCYFWQGQNYTQSGTYTDTVITQSGQDSLVRLVLTMLRPDSSFQTASACTGYTWNGVTYTASGRYYQHIDRNTVGCDSVAVLDLIIERIPASPVARVVHPTCIDTTGSITVLFPLSSEIRYRLDGGAYQSSTQFSGLQPGTYQLYAQTPLGCTSPAASVTVQPIPVAPATPVIATVQPSCFGLTGSVTVLAPLRADYQYALDGGVYQSTRIFNSVPAGSHLVNVIDSNGCESSVVAVLSQPALLSMTATSGSIACYGGTTTVAVAATGGTAPYSGTGVFTVSTGTYNYTVTDSRGCSSTRNVTVTEPGPMIAANSFSQVRCYGGVSTVNVMAVGGTPPYSGTGTFTVSPGTYSYTVVDSRGCSATTNVIISQPAAMTVMATASSITCFGGTSNVTIGAVGGTAPYTGTGTFTVPAGTYTYTVTDNAGCTSTRSLSISQPPVLNAYANSAGISCFGQRASITVSATGGTPQYTGTGVYSVPSGPYNYTVTDANGCTAGVGIIITEPPVLNATATVSSPLVCNGGTGLVSVAATGGTAPYTGVGLFAQPSGTTTYTVLDNNGCQSTSSITLTQPSAITGTVIVTNSTCTNPGTATVSVSGGVAPYSFLWSNGATTAAVGGLVAGSYSVTVTDQNSCTRIFTCSIRLNAVYPGLAGSITGQTTVRANATFTYNILPVSGATSYRWTLPSNCTGSSTTNSINVTFLTGFTGGSICVTPVNACGDGGTSCKAVTIPTIAGPGGPGKVKDKIPTGLGNGLGSILNGDSLSATDDGASGMSVNPSAPEDAATGLSAPSLESIRNLVAYPNPSRGKIVIGFNGLKDAKYLMQLVDMSGSLIAELTVTGQEEMSQILYDTSILAAGVYNLSVTKADGGQRRTIKLVVQ